MDLRFSTFSVYNVYCDTTGVIYGATTALVNKYLLIVLLDIRYCVCLYFQYKLMFPVTNIMYFPAKPEINHEFSETKKDN